MPFHKTKKKLSTIIIIAGVITIGFFTIYKIKRDDFLHHKLKNVVAEKSNELYKLKYDSLSVNEVEGNLFIKNFHLKGDTSRQLKMINTGDTNAAKFLLDIFIPELKVVSFKTTAALLSKELQCKQIVISNAKIICYLYPGLQKPGDTKKQQQEIYKQILGSLQLIRVENVSVINSEVIAEDFYTKEVKLHTHKTTIGLTDVAIDSTFNQDTTRTFFCKEIRMQSQQVTLEDRKKTAEIANASFDTRSKILVLGKFEYGAFKTNGYFKTKLEGISLQGISWTGPVENSELTIDKAVFQKGELVLVDDDSSNKKNSSKVDTKILTGWISKFSLHSLQLKSFAYVSSQAGSNDKPFRIKNNSFSIKNIKIDRTTVFDETLVSRAEEIVISNDEMRFITADKLYEYRLRGVKLNSLTKNIFIKEAAIIPAFNERDFAKKAHFQTDRFDIAMRNINCKEVDIPKLIKGEINIGLMTSVGNSVKVFRDLSYPKDTASNGGPQRNFPHQLIHKFSGKIKINRYIANKSYIEYKEKNAGTNSAGKVRFSNSSLSLNNISNYSVKVGEKTTCAFSTMFLGKVPVKGNFTFYLDDWKKGKFSVSAVVNKSFDVTIINELTEPMSLIKIEKGVVNSLRFKMTADTTLAKSNLVFLYEDLKLSFVKKKGSEYKNKSVFSFFANLIIKNNNKPGDGMRQANITVKHKRFSSFFNFIWSTMLTGIKDISMLKI